MLEQIKKNYITSMKEKDVVTKRTLSLLINEINNETKKNQKDLTDDETTKIILKEVKKRNQSIEQYTNGGRLDLAESEIEELKILNEYLPEPLTDDEVRTYVEQYKKDNPDIIEGKLIGIVNQYVKGRFTIDNIKRIVKESF